jgi:hypothetical protein
MRILTRSFLRDEDGAVVALAVLPRLDLRRRRVFR